MPIVNLNLSNIQPLENRRLYIRGDNLKALIEKWHSFDKEIKLNEVKDTRAGLVHYIKVYCPTCKMMNIC